MAFKVKGEVNVKPQTPKRKGKEKGGLLVQIQLKGMDMY